MLAERTDGQRGERDAELHRGDEARRVARDPQHVARAPVALMVQLDDPRAPGRDEAVLGRDEERVEQDQDCNADELVEEGHAPTPGAHVLDGCSSTRLRRSIGHAPVVLGARRAAEHDEPLEVRERLGDGEAALDRRQLPAEDRVRDLVAAARLVGERSRRLVEALVVVCERSRARARPARRPSRRARRTRRADRALRCRSATGGSRRADRAGSPGRARPPA